MSDGAVVDADIRDRLIRVETLVETLGTSTSQEITMLREKAHDFSNMLHVSTAEMQALKAQVSSIAASVGRLVDTVTMLAPLTSRIESHEETCLAAHQRNNEHFTRLEEKIDQGARSREEGMSRIQGALWRAAFWVIGVLTTAITALGGAVWYLVSPHLAHLLGH